MPQLGMAIGGMIGGWISPTQVNGPRPGDGAAQSSADGQPIAWVLGTAGWVQGNISQKSERRIVKKTDDGKGSGTEVNTYEAHQDFLILICESSETRNSLMAGVLMVRVDGKVVYDKRPESNFTAENSKFLRNHTFYDGNEAQMPDPTMEAITGVGTTLYYRGVFTMVARDINLAPYGDRIPTYEFVMVGAGSSDSETVVSYSPPLYGRFQNADWPLVDPESFYTLTGTRDDTGGDTSFSAPTIAEIIAHFAALGYNGYPDDPSTYLGYSASTSLSPGTTHKTSMVTTQLDVTSNTSVVLVYNNSIPEEYYDLPEQSADDVCPLLPYSPPGFPEWYGFQQGDLARIQAGGANPPQYPPFTNCTGLPPDGGFFPYVQGQFALYIRAESKAAPPSTAPLGDPCQLGVPVALPDDPGFVIDCAGVITPQPTYVLEVGSFLTLQKEEVLTTGGRNIYSKRNLAPIILETDPIGTEAFWTDAYDAAVLAGKMEAGLVYGVDYPEEIGSAYESTVTTPTLETGPLALSDAITRICLRGGLTIDDIDVTDMDQDLLGYPILQSYNGADCLRPLLTAFPSFGSEYDAQLHFHKHGAATDMVIDPDDFIEGTDHTEQDTRNQPVEYPRLFNVSSIDPTQDYTVRPQTERRLSPDIRARGETGIDLSVVLMPNDARQLAAIGMKVQWARQQGPTEFSLPYATANACYLEMVPGGTYSLYGKRYVIDDHRTEDGEIHMVGQYDRQSAYTSDVTATPALPPTAPPTNIGGVTISAFMNLPSLRTQDNVPGIYAAACGLLSSWPGCYVQMSTDDEASWTTVIGSLTQPSVIGYLTADLADAPPGLDVTNTLSVNVHGGELNSITEAQFENEENPAAIINADGTIEILQFQDADEIEAGSYELTTLNRGGLNTPTAAHPAGSRFVGLPSVYFVPLDAGLAGRTLYFRPVTFNTSPESNASYPLVFEPPTFIIDGGGA